jgi:hypothetical protein
LDSLQIQKMLPEGWSYVPAAELGDGRSLALGTMCAVSLGGRGGSNGPAANLLLRECRQELGLIRAADGQLYGCSTAARLLAFASAPAAALAGVQRQVVRHSLLVQLLGMQQVAPQCDLRALLAAPAHQQAPCDSGTQTPVHFVQQHIDRSYDWNAWAQRRRALALANLRSKRTHSTQTTESHFKRDGQTQVSRRLGGAVYRQC